MSHIYIGTGGYADSDLLGTVYPLGTAKEDFLTHYCRHYDTVEINSSFHAPIGEKALKGMLEKSDGKLKFSIKLHQDFSHNRTATGENAKLFLNALQPLIQQQALGTLFLQFPHRFERNTPNRRYLAELTQWFMDYPMAVEFRHPSWHCEAVFEAFCRQPHLIWGNVDYPPNIGLPTFQLKINQSTGYLRLHGRNANWWRENSAQARHNYRYTEDELTEIANLIVQQKERFEKLFIYFQNTTQSHSFYNIVMLKNLLIPFGFEMKTQVDEIPHQQWDLF
ncbi:hypothetical protein BKK54_00775 [Rodentibacter genomosp. 1]|uniref:DUF72 domain-containing protein n=1 Tax=Rodentibacter genomosp. 1 TaxID=1908264 RepID=A0A1V3J911_9PAST|nr:DUF72 domain-containing protein [Rodentibacter genomosp. 1]OOF51906.1 hypothetical protein BKK54_00775 [Rodentibacter genomosp. 1]